MTKSSFGNRIILIKRDFINPFLLSFRSIKEKWRWLRPDAIHSYRKEWILSNSVKIMNIKNDDNEKIYFEICPISNDKRSYYYVVCNEFKSSSGNPDNCIIKYNKAIFKEYSKEKFNTFINKIRNVQYKEWIYILDWKYKDISMFLNQNDSVNKDIVKQLCYEFCLQNSSILYDLQSQFVIPFFYSGNRFYDSEEDKVGFRVNKKELYRRLKESKIEVFKANFYTMQNAYLNND